MINIQKRGGNVGKCEVVDRLKKNAIEEFISNMLKDGKTPEEIADFCHLDLKKVKEVQIEYLVIKQDRVQSSHRDDTTP